MSGRPWTPEDVAEADRLVREGLNSEQVAQAAGRTVQALKAARIRRRRRGDVVPDYDPAYRLSVTAANLRIGWERRRSRDIDPSEPDEL